MVTLTVPRKTVSAAILCLFLRGIPAFPQEANFSTAVNLVVLDVSVTRSDGRPVGGLEQNNFLVFENGKPVEITKFEKGSAPVSMALVVDFSGSMRDRHRAVSQAVDTLVSLLKPEDEAEMITFNDIAAVTAPLAPARQIGANAWSRQLLGAAPTGRTALYDACLLAASTLTQSANGRRVMIVISDGKDTISQTKLSEVEDQLRTSNFLLYSVGLFDPSEPETDAGVLKKLAGSTGGLAIFESDVTHLAGALTGIMADIRARYILGYSTEDAPPGRRETRKVSVKVVNAGRGLHVRSRHEYSIGTFSSSSR